MTTTRTRRLATDRRIDSMDFSGMENLKSIASHWINLYVQAELCRATENGSSANFPKTLFGELNSMSGLLSREVVADAFVLTDNRQAMQEIVMRMEAVVPIS